MENEIREWLICRWHSLADLWISYEICKTKKEKHIYRIRIIQKEKYIKGMLKLID